MGKAKHKRNERGEKIEDERFAAATSRPQFQLPRDNNSKVVLDERFSSVLTDPRFRVEGKDKYGRRKKKKEKPKAESELSAFYTVDMDVEKEQPAPERTSPDEESVSSSNALDRSENNETEKQDPASRIAFLTALSRGELSVSSSSDEDESDSSDDEHDDSGSDEDSSNVGILDPTAAKEEEEEVSLTEEPSRYMAVMSMDWAHVRAVDLFAVLSSFAPPGSVKRVQIFPSDFGMERMAKEEKFGPSGLWKRKKNEQAPEEEEDNGTEDNNEDSHTSTTREELQDYDVNPNAIDSDFDPEKLRAYEASKLKYFFAVVEFARPEDADLAYREVDGLELEHSSAAMDLRSIATGELKNVVKDRPLRDEALAVPSNYEPPDFVLSALQQTSVRCTWEDGDAERERKLTGYGNGRAGGWGDLTEENDLRAYLASDISSEEDNDSMAEDEAKSKGAQMRKMLGLDSDDDSSASDVNNSLHATSSSESEGDGEFSKEETFVPGKRDLEVKIRSKLQSSREASKEVTPWERYQEKRKEKQRERRRAARGKKKGATPQESHGGIEDDGIYVSDPQFDALEFNDDDVEGNDFFLDENGDTSRPRDTSTTKEKDTERTYGRNEELELLLAGDNDEEEAKDYDIRGLLRIAKNKDKKLRGARKRKEATLAANVSGADFKIDTKDERFAPLLDGTDGRFGIDRTHPSFKETPAMTEILSVQTKRRKAKKAEVEKRVAPNIDADHSAPSEQSGGAADLSALVKSLKSKVAKTGQ